MDNDDPEYEVSVNELGRMCLLISRVPLLRDTNTSMEEWNKREDEMNKADGDSDEEGEGEGSSDEEEEDESGAEDGEEDEGEIEAKMASEASAAHRRGMLLQQKSLASRRLIDTEENVEMY